MRVAGWLSRLPDPFDPPTILRLLLAWFVFAAPLFVFGWWLAGGGLSASVGANRVVMGAVLVGAFSVWFLRQARSQRRNRQHRVG
jgi:hypothetical protein